MVRVETLLLLRDASLNQRLVHVVFSTGLGYDMVRLMLGLGVEVYLAGVPEPGLNRRVTDCVPLRQGGGLKILWRRPPRVQIPPPAPWNSEGRSWDVTNLCADRLPQEATPHVLARP